MAPKRPRVEPTSKAGRKAVLAEAQRLGSIIHYNQQISECAKTKNLRLAKKLFRQLKKQARAFRLLLFLSLPPFPLLTLPSLRLTLS